MRELVFFSRNFKRQVECEAACWKIIDVSSTASADNPD